MTIQIIAGLLLLAALALTYVLYRLQRNDYALRRSLLLHQRERRAVVSFLNRMGDLLTTRIDLDATLEAILNFCVESTNAQSGAVFLRDPAAPDTLVAHGVYGLFPPLKPAPDKIFARHQYLAERLKKEPVRMGEGIVGKVAEQARPLLIAEARLDPMIPPSANQIVQIETLMAAPLLVRGELVGVIVLVNRRTENDPFRPDDLDLLCALADQAAITVNLVRVYSELSEKQRLEQELEVAHQFQEMLLPREAPIVEGLEIAGYSAPAQEVGGDYYDFFDVDAEHLGIAIADVAGKGIPGAVVMATVRSTLRAEARGDLSPRAVLLRLNRQLLLDTSPNVFVTMTYAVLNRRTFRLRFARAGHEPVIICSQAPGENPSLYTPEGIALGLVGDDLFQVTEEREVGLQSGEVVVFYTDGVVEARNRGDEEYGAGRFLNLLQAQVERSPREIIQAVMSDVNDFTGGAAQHDDITLVALKALRAGERLTLRRAEERQIMGA